MHIEENKLGIGSFAFRYEIGIVNYMPKNPMDAQGFLIAAEGLGFRRIQLCENLKFADYNVKDLMKLSSMAKERNIVIELGFSNINFQNLRRHIEIADILDSKFIRAVIGEPSDDQKKSRTIVIDAIGKSLDDLKNKGICIGIENHFDLSTSEIINIVKTINSPEVGTVYDTTNAINFLEHPEMTLELMLPYIKSVHLKDFQMKKGEACIIMTGRILGEGRLNIKQILKKIMDANHDASIIMEMTIPRNINSTSSEVIEEEKRQIEASSRYLFETTRKFI